MRAGMKRGRLAAAAAAIVVVAVPALWWIRDPIVAWAVVVAATFLSLSLSEAVPPFVPTLVLLVMTPLALGRLDAQFQLGAVLRWPAEPIVALFAGGMALGLAAQRRAVDASIAGLVVRVAGTRARSLVALVMIGTAVFSMWMSNVAAAPMMIAALRPLTQDPGASPELRRALLLAIAVGANLGGIATPIGTGPNGIAIAAVQDQQTISFLHWMAFAVPLVAGLLAIAFVLVIASGRVAGALPTRTAATPALDRAGVAVVVLFFVAVSAWLSEPLHGVSPPIVALAVTAVLFGSGLLTRDDLGALDWSTLGLIAGGLCLGRLIEASGVLSHVTDLPWSAYPRWAWLGGLVLASALMAAVMSNTASVALLVPVGLSIDPSPSTAVVIAIGASFGMPFPISTPPNAMIYGSGEVTSRDLLRIGLPLMLLGCAAVTFTGPTILRLLGVP
jgi:sodium-dependent dicarboxylate transporter 2/3/5